jgi:hypothetical protein
MLLPRETLIAWRRRGESIPAIAAAFGVSEQLCEWRVRMTGVDVQLKRVGGREPMAAGAFIRTPAPRESHRT